MKTSQAQKLKSSIKTGDHFKLGDHILICGDSTAPDTLSKLPPELKINLILTDPPYGVDYVNSKSGFKQFSDSHKSIANDHIQSNESYSKFTTNWIEAVKQRLASKNSIYIFNSDRMIFSLKEGMDKCDIKLSQLLIWLKNASIIGRLDYQPQHELIAYGWYGKHKFRKSKDKSVIAHPKPTKSKLHPTMKPVGLLRRLILNSSELEDIVYDPFGGSGSTLIACEQTKRRCIMVEQSPEYCRVIIERFQKLTKLPANLIAL